MADATCRGRFFYLCRAFVLRRSKAVFRVSTFVLNRIFYIAASSYSLRFSASVRLCTPCRPTPPTVLPAVILCSLCRFAPHAVLIPALRYAALHTALDSAQSYSSTVLLPASFCASRPSALCAVLIPPSFFSSPLCSLRCSTPLRPLLRTALLPALLCFPNEADGGFLP